MTPAELEAEQLKFQIADYNSKVQYLKDHFTRVWARFNFFLTLQSACFGAAILSDKYHWRIPAFGMLLCLLWYLFGSQDRYLVALYRKQIEHAMLGIKAKLQLANYFYIGQTENVSGQTENVEDLDVPPLPYQWRSSTFSTTKLAALFPLIVFLIWLGILLFAHPSPPAVH